MHRARKIGWIAGIAMAAVSGVAVAAPTQGPGLLDPVAVAQSLVDQTASRVGATGRGLDQATNPDYLQRILPHVVSYLDGSDTQTVLLDPFRAAWADTRGQHATVTYRNRYDATIVADLYGPSLPFVDPVTGVATDGPLPALVLVPGYGSRATDYEGVAESLAEAGYVVLAFDAQAQGRSDTEPGPGFCDPAGAWRRPQEAGLRESGTCAGTPTIPPTNLVDGLANQALAGIPGSSLVTGPLFTAQLQLDRQQVLDEISDLYGAVGPNFAFGALDAADFLLSGANPWRPLVDPARVGVLGHSLGAWGAVTAANGDPQHRFAAAAGFDGYTSPAASPRVPTLFLAADGMDTDFPRRVPPDPDTDHPWLAAARWWRMGPVDTMQVALASSTHMEWYHTPLALLNPLAGLNVNSSSDGERVSVYYLQAWFDLQLKGRAGGSPARGDWEQQRADALRRLTATVLDGSVDGSSIGQGTYDLTTGANRPYTVAGERAADHLSPMYRSAYDVSGQRCDDLRAGCG